MKPMDYVAPLPCSFGLSSAIDPSKTHVSCIHNGTPYYVAPEISGGSGRVTKSSDVYSFGIMMVEVYR